MRIGAALLLVMPAIVVYGAVCGGVIASGFVWSAVRRPR